MSSTEITFFYPGDSFPSISTTGERCALDCRHCAGRFLHGMRPLESPEALWDFSLAHQDRGGTGMLVSGGCDANGRMDYSGFYETFSRIKAGTSLLINAHPGIVDGTCVERLAEAGVDAISADVVGSLELLELIYGIERSPMEMEDFVNALSRAGSRVVPHICLGLDMGRIGSEHNALDLVLELEDVRGLVINILMPVAGTEFQDLAPPELQDVEGFVREARTRLPDLFLVLGCMRPRGMGYGELAVELGLDGIVNPSSRARELARELGLRTEKKDSCCAMF